MTPAEKADELVTNYRRCLPMNLTTMLDAKNFALIAVDEIINANPTGEYGDPFIGNHTYDNKDYWTAVKQEIEQL
jgi:hypothetical protein